jgi:hypothetical protein
MDFSKTLIRCSSLSCLFTEPKEKAAKDRGDLSATAKTHLTEIYAREYWGVEKDIVTKQMKKGTEAEEEGITLLSRVDKRMYEKCDEKKNNEWLSGHADIVCEDEIVDMKLSYDAFSFLPQLTNDVDKNYYYQLQGYMWLWDRPKGRIAYCLVDTPDHIIAGERYRLLRSMNVVSEESPEFLEKARILESNMRFSHLPMEERVINHYVERNEEVIASIPSKVAKAREYLQLLHEKHLSLNKQTP